MKTFRLLPVCDRACEAPFRRSDLELNKSKRLCSILLPALVLCLCSLPATASMLFSDSGSPDPAYDNNSQWAVCGAGSFCGASSNIASLFTVPGSGNQPVSQVDFAVGYVVSSDSFNASIWTDVAGQPGTQVTNANWNLSTTTMIGTCCSLATVTGIAGVNLTGGQQYFMVLAPLDPADSSWNGWFYNNQNFTDVVLSSTDGGSTWANANGIPSNTLGAFDVLGGTSGGTVSGAPEPGALLLFGTGLIGMLVAYRLKANN